MEAEDKKSDETRIGKGTVRPGSTRFGRKEQGRILFILLIWRHHCGIACPPQEELRARNRMAIPEGRVSEVDVVVVPPDDVENVAASILAWGKIDNHGLTAIGANDDLIERP